MAPGSPPWISTLRHALKAEHGRGWSVREQSGKVQLTHRYEDGSRTSVDLGLEWNSGCIAKVIERVAAIRDRMECQQLCLATANELISRTRARKPDQVDWAEIVALYRQARVSSGEVKATTWERDIAPRMKRTLATLASRPTPRDGSSLLEMYSSQHLAHCRPGGAGRKRNLLDVAGLLRFAVHSCGAPRRWLPLEGDSFNRLLGLSENPQDQSVPITTSQLEKLLCLLAADGKDELRLAVALVGLYGLRPAELMVLSFEDGHLRVGNVKRNRRTARNPKPPRLVLPLDLPGLPGEGHLVLSKFASGELELPKGIRNARDFKACGEAFRQYLDRYPPWRAMVASSPGLSPYGLRHGYAWRGHKGYERPIPIRDLAALMGHNPATHHRHYGKWTQDADLIEVVERLTKRN